MSSGAVLHVESVVVRYGTVTAVDGVSLTVGAGETVGIAGTIGAGKSSLLRAISGVVPLSSGQCLFDAVGIERRPPFERARLGIAHVPEGRRMMSKLTVEENLIAGAGAFGPRLVAKAVDHSISLFPELEPLLRRRAGVLSGGEQQMVAIARALVSEPKLVMLDEPSLGLAPAVVERVGRAIKKISEQGCGVLLAEERLDLLGSVADTIHALRYGRIVGSFSRGPEAALSPDVVERVGDLMLEEATIGPDG